MTHIQGIAERISRTDVNLMPSFFCTIKYRSVLLLTLTNDQNDTTVSCKQTTMDCFYCVSIFSRSNTVSVQWQKETEVDFITTRNKDLCHRQVHRRCCLCKLPHISIQIETPKSFQIEFIRRFFFFNIVRRRLIILPKLKS